MLDDIKKLHKPPKQVNILGQIIEADNNNIVVIGTRTMTNYGKDVINNFVPRFVKMGLTIISGLAIGCDAYAQEVALRSGGRTIGILGYGFDHIKNDYNKSIIKKVYQSDRGVLVSPFPKYITPAKHTFIYRNSVMAAMGKSIFVVEAREHSGVFYTVNAALEMGKDIYAVPGSIFNYNSAGCNALIKEGATPVTSMKDFSFFDKT